VWTISRQTIKIKTKNSQEKRRLVVMIISSDNCSWEFIRLLGLSGKIIGIALNVQYFSGKERDSYIFFERLKESTIPQQKGVIVQKDQIVLEADGRNFKVALNIDGCSDDQSGLLSLHKTLSSGTKIITSNIIFNKDKNATIKVWCS
jgi:hypothetical protein